MSRSAPELPTTGTALARNGLTLIEVLVSLMLLSLLAAAVFPVVTQRVGSAEPVRAVQELTLVREAIEQFAAELEGALPEDLDDLVNRPDTNDRRYLSGGVLRPYDEALAERWSGPYLDVPLGDGGALATGFGLPIRDDLVLFDGRAGLPIPDAGEGIERDSIFLAVRLGRPGRPLTPAQFEAINDLIDGTGEAAGGAAEGSWRRGRFRFVPSSGGTGGIGYYLAVPVTP